MPILRDFLSTSFGSPNSAVLPLRRKPNMTQEEFYQAQQDNLRTLMGSPVDATVQPADQQQFANDPRSGDYVEYGLQQMANRKAPPSLEPGARVKYADTSQYDPKNFESYYSMLGSIKEIGANQLAAEEAKAAYRQRQALSQAANGGGASVGSTPTGRYTGSFGKGVEQWRGTALQVMRELGIPDQYIGDVLRRMNQESGGNPNVQNNWDSNAKRGTPSIGLMQTIGPTFNRYAGKYANKGITDPYANIYAGLNYAGNRYGPSHGGFVGGVIYAMNKPGGY